MAGSTGKPDGGFGRGPRPVAKDYLQVQRVEERLNRSLILSIGDKRVSGCLSAQALSGQTYAEPKEKDITMRFAVLGAIAAAFLTTVAPASAQDAADCRVRGDLDAQIRKCTDLIERSGTSARDRGVALLYRCQAFDMGGNPQRALEDCLAASGANPKDSSIYNSLNIVYRNLGRLEDSVAAASKAISLSGTEGAHFAGRAASYCKLGEVELSVDDRVRSIELGYLSASRVQNFLADRGFYRGTPSGRMDNATRRALEDWTRAGC